MTSKFTNPLRVLAWACALCLILTPLIAMQFTDEVQWTALDFIVMAVLLGSVGLALEMAISLSLNTCYRIGVSILLLSLLLLIWVNLAVGIIGGDGDVHNILYLFVPISGFVFAKRAKFNAQGMLNCSFGMSFVQLIITLIAIVFSWGLPYSTPTLLLMGNGLFIVMYLFAGSFFIEQISK